MRENTLTESGSAGAPTLTRAPSRASRRQVGVEVDLRAHRVHDEVERAGELLERLRILRGVVVVRTEAQAVLLLVQRLRQDGDLGTHRVRELHGHVPEPAQTDDGHLLAGAGAPMAQRRVRRDAGAQQRRGGVEPDALGNLEDEVLGHDDVGGIAALGELAVLPDAAVGPGEPLEAVLLLALAAARALATGVDQAADADAVADGMPGDLGADLGDDPGDLMAGDDGVGHRTPLTARVVDVGVADAAELDLDEDVVRAEVTTLDGRRTEGLRRGRGRVGIDGEHVSPELRGFGAVAPRSRREIRPEASDDYVPGSQ